VAGPGWLGVAQPRWAELGPAPPQKNRKYRNKNFACLRKKNIFFNLFTDIRIRNRKKYILIFFIATNFYQRQSWNYSWWNFYQHQSWNYLGLEFLPTPELELFEIEYSLAPESGIL